MLSPCCGGAAEIFTIDETNIGISVPTRLLDSVGEETIRTALGDVRVYDLYAGVWSEVV